MVFKHWMTKYNNPWERNTNNRSSETPSLRPGEFPGHTMGKEKPAIRTSLHREDEAQRHKASRDQSSVQG